ncbi:putative GTPase or GTP-binding protein [Caldisphaera lagunensis DSM 15908]|uniref:polynucleotide 5'-hydroxyl-kinase n=1 Tax=Caldisphaera lagunensis (strain DSM 15908 / JCM 11604 / ANMR 0165 / IC-154) TaxID=1056495 RepID=L0ABQ3_CALLD|nr:Clp1/GlmU family protein [Caldisphaera lagunensis]AFZ70475.1 putative GTPase or GTP-binding protein [Caldisphaera lagunensis DSM 15908]
MNCEKFDGSYILLGPSSVVIINGEVEILGFDINKKINKKIIVPIGRSIPIKANNACLNINPSSKNIVKVESKTNEIFEKIYNEIFEKRKILIIGPTDSGKSTLAAFLINRFYSKGIRAKIMSADLGQNEVYCPTFVSTAEIDPPYIPGWKGSIANVKSCFVGDISSFHNKQKYIECIEKLGKDDNLIIDTDGLVNEEAIKLKLSLIQNIDIDAVISIDLNYEITNLNNIKIIQVNKLFNKEKSRYERKENRDRLISQCILSSRKRIINLNEINITNKENLFPGSIAGIESPDGNQYFGLIYKIINDNAVLITEYDSKINRIEVGKLTLNINNYKNLIESL